MLMLTLHKQWLESRREGRLLWLFLMLILLLVVALGSGWAQYQQAGDIRQQVSAAERERWLDQGNKGPHAAAHYGIYVIKPQTPLAVLDPGLSAYQGNVLRLEAHKQNNTLFRQIEDRVAMQRFGQLSPAFIMQTLLPLFIILSGFHLIAAERESGTLKQLLASGVNPAGLFYAKMLSLSGFVLLFLCPVIGYLLWRDDSDLSRSLFFIGGYAVYMVIWSMITMITSAYSATARQALVILLMLWSTGCLLLPKLVMDDAVSRYPLQSSRVFDAKLETTVYTPQRQQALTQFKQQTLDKYQVSTTEHLPFAWAGAQLQFGEDYANRLTLPLYQARNQQLDSQNQHYSHGGLLSPFIALQVLSMSAAATDFSHDLWFVDMAEQHRQQVQRILNSDLKFNGKDHDDDHGYQADHLLWQKIPHFNPHYPALSQVSSIHLEAMLSLVGWFVLLLSLCVLAIKRLTKERRT